MKTQSFIIPRQGGLVGKPYVISIDSMQSHATRTRSPRKEERYAFLRKGKRKCRHSTPGGKHVALFRGSSQEELKLARFNAAPGRGHNKNKLLSLDTLVRAFMLPWQGAMNTILAVRSKQHSRPRYRKRSVVVSLVVRN